MSWLPISSAPKDGTKVLIFVPANHPAAEDSIFAAWWDAEFEIVNALAKSKKKMYRGGWTDYAVESFGYERVAEYKPTHWQPLPDGPDTTPHVFEGAG